MSGAVKDLVVAIIAEKALLRAQDVHLNQSLADLGIDSLGMVEAIFSIEEAFDIAIPFNANETETSGFGNHSVAVIIDEVRRLVAQSGR